MSTLHLWPSFLDLFYFTWMGVCSCVGTHIYIVLLMPGRGHQTPPPNHRTRVTGSCELPYGLLGTKTGPLQEPQPLKHRGSPPPWPCLDLLCSTSHWMKHLSCPPTGKSGTHSWPSLSTAFTMKQPLYHKKAQSTTSFWWGKSDTHQAWDAPGPRASV